MSSETKVCQNCKTRFTVEPEDFVFYEKMQVPPPTFCPDCRAVRRLVRWNQRQLFRRKDALTGKEIFSSYPEAAPIKVYDRDYWWSDAFDGSQYGRDYDFSRPFFEQFRNLMHDVPWFSRSVKNLVNSDYCNEVGELKNCYLCFSGNAAENCLYGVSFVAPKDSMDFYSVRKIESCYEVFSSALCYRTFFTSESEQCRNVWFSLNCNDCSDCFGCVNLRHKQYHIFNKSYSKDEYEKRIKEFNLGSYRALQEVKATVAGFWRRFPTKYMHGTDNVHSVGEYLYHSKDARYCYEAMDLERVSYGHNLSRGVKDSYDYLSWGDNVELMYEAVVCGENERKVRFAVDCWPACRDVEYSMLCSSSSSLFGCVGLKKKSYCIFNKQYTPEEYQVLRAKIIQHMNDMPYKDARGNSYRYGEFFPEEFSPFAYNESSAQDFYPLTKEEALRRGFEWREPNPREFQVTMIANDLPDHIDDATDAVTKEVLGCIACRRAFRIVPAEFAFYKRFALSLPRKCHNCRFEDRVNHRNLPRWYRRKCMCVGQSSEGGFYANTSMSHPSHASNNHCPNEFETSYAPDRPEIVYCEACYNAEVV